MSIVNISPAMIQTCAGALGTWAVSGDKARLTLFFVVVAVLLLGDACLLLAYLSKWLGWRSRFKHIFRSPKIHTVLSLSILLQVFAVINGFFIEPTWLSVTHVKMHIANLPSSLKTPIRLVHISDLHIGREGIRVPNLANRVNALSPDLIVLTGDYLNHRSGAKHFSAFLRLLKAPSGIYAVKGNFDHKPLASQLLVENNVTLLNNKIARVSVRKARLDLFGMTPWPKDGLGTFKRQPSPSVPSILLTHYPYWIIPASKASFDIVLCGHTHGGQVRLPWYGAIVTRSKLGKRFESGYYKEQGTQVYVSRGIGLEPLPAPPVRFLCRPEITLIELSCNPIAD